MTTYGARIAGCRPGTVAAGKTFSVGIGDVNSRAAAIYRSRGDVEHEVEVDALALRCVAWLNSPVRAGMSPSGIAFMEDLSARIVLTPAGKKQGFLRP